MRTNRGMHLSRLIINNFEWVSLKIVMERLQGSHYRPEHVYQSITEEEAVLELDRFAERWDEKYPQISKSWRANWPNLITLFNYPPDIRKVIYTANAIEFLNSMIRQSVKTRKVFQNENAL